ncbi:MAG: single-stranded-DNA-specific exonuclease RecJ, partial [Paracoccaceae bacterium]
MRDAATPELVTQLEAAGPFGAGASAPRFAFADQPIRFAKRLGAGHLKFSFGDGGGPPVEGIAFSAFDGGIGAEILDHGGRRFHLAGRLEINTWQGKSRVQLRLEDAAPADD